MDLGPCPICLVPCPIADLVEHIVHAHAATKKQKCEKCTKEFELKSDLENHIKEKHSQPEIVECFEGQMEIFQWSGELCITQIKKYHHNYWIMPF